MWDVGEAGFNWPFELCVVVSVEIDVVDGELAEDVGFEIVHCVGAFLVGYAGDVENVGVGDVELLAC